jgi:hypothetical protein
VGSTVQDKDGREVAILHKQRTPNDKLY